MTLPPITNKQKAIINYLFTFRFLTTNHFHKLFNHKDKHRIKEWLRDLVEKKYIDVLDTRNSYKDNSQPFTYYLAAQARQILKENKTCDVSKIEWIYKEKTRKEKFITHCLAIADIYLFFLSQKAEDQELFFYTQTELTSFDYFPDPLPSAYVAVKTKEHTSRYFLDFFDDYTPPFVLRNRVKQYLKYADNGNWEEHANEEPLPSVLFVCPSKKLKSHIAIYAKALFEKAYQEKISLFVTTKQTILQGGNNIWEKVNIATE